MLPCARSSPCQTGEQEKVGQDAEQDTKIGQAREGLEEPELRGPQAPGQGQDPRLQQGRDIVAWTARTTSTWGLRAAGPAAEPWPAV